MDFESLTIRPNFVGSAILAYIHDNEDAISDNDGPEARNEYDYDWKPRDGKLFNDPEEGYHE